jgi:hypothetical protein
MYFDAQNDPYGMAAAISANSAQPHRRHPLADRPPIPLLVFGFGGRVVTVSHARSGYGPARYGGVGAAGVF